MSQYRNYQTPSINLFLKSEKHKDMIQWQIQGMDCRDVEVAHPFDLIVFHLFDRKYCPFFYLFILFRFVGLRQPLFKSLIILYFWWRGYEMILFIEFLYIESHTISKISGTRDILPWTIYSAVWWEGCLYTPAQNADVISDIKWYICVYSNYCVAKIHVTYLFNTHPCEVFTISEC